MDKTFEFPMTTQELTEFSRRIVALPPDTGNSGFIPVPLNPAPRGAVLLEATTGANTPLRQENGFAYYGPGQVRKLNWTSANRQENLIVTRSFSNGYWLARYTGPGNRHDHFKAILNTIIPPKYR